MFISFIVPVYNCEQYLSDCLDPLLSQDIDKSDYEIICINDGSTDRSLEVLENYAQNYACVTVINNSNAGVAEARNNGLRIAKGEYIWFVDSDDLIQTNILRELQVIACYKKSDRIEVECYHFFNSLSDDEWEKYQMHSLPINCHYYDSVVTHSLFRREFLETHDIKFHYPEVSNGEDVVFMFEFSTKHPLKTTIAKPYYLYRERAASLTTAKTKESLEKQQRSYLLNSLTMKRYYDEHLEGADTLLMFFLWREMRSLAALSKKDARPHLLFLKGQGLYPFKKPKTVNQVKSFETSRTDAIGRLFDLVYTNSTTRIGYHAMRIFLCARSIKNLVKHSK